MLETGTICSLSDSNEIRSQNHLVPKLTLKQLAMNYKNVLLLIMSLCSLQPCYNRRLFQLHEVVETDWQKFLNGESLLHIKVSGPSVFVS